MVMSGYTMDLYCDCKDCTSYRRNYAGDGGSHSHDIAGFKQFDGDNFKDCLKQAKSEGWVFKLNNTLCFMPGHNIVI